MNRRLKIKILESGLSQVEVADAVRLSETKFSRIVRGRVHPSEAEKKKIARILKCEVSDIFQIFDTEDD